jgi:hypothetical protein
VLSTGYEQGLLGLAFHPDYRTNGRYIVNYTRVLDGATVNAEYRMASDPNQSLPSEKTVLVIPQPYSNHNGEWSSSVPMGSCISGWGTEAPEAIRRIAGRIETNCWAKC